jgi:hypothetical protein
VAFPILYHRNVGRARSYKENAENSTPGGSTPTSIFPTNRLAGVGKGLWENYTCKM